MLALVPAAFRLQTTYIEGCVNDVNYPVDSGVRATRPLFEVRVSIYMR